MTPKIKTIPDLAVNSSAHQSAIATGDDHFRLWERNVIDRFKSVSDEEIKQTLQQESFPFAICCEHVIGDFNMGTIVRNANAFGAREFYYIGNKKWDKRSAVGVYNFTPVQWLPSVDDFKQLQLQYHFIGIDNIPGAIPLSQHQWQENTMIILGEEGTGLTPFSQSLCEKIVYIPQYGSVRSLNVGTASGIIMHDFVERYRS